MAFFAPKMGKSADCSSGMSDIPMFCRVIWASIADIVSGVTYMNGVFIAEARSRPAPESFADIVKLSDDWPVVMCRIESMVCEKMPSGDRAAIILTARDFSNMGDSFIVLVYYCKVLCECVSVD